VTALDPLALLQSHTYTEVQALTGLSRGAIYRLATSAGARKTEERIRAATRGVPRAAQRGRDGRRLQFL
jgi:hypothetical protein